MVEEHPIIEEMTEEEFLIKEQRICQSYRDGMILLEDKRQALENLQKKWESQS